MDWKAQLVKLAQLADPKGSIIPVWEYTFNLLGPNGSVVGSTVFTESSTKPRDLKLGQTYGASMQLV